MTMVALMNAQACTWKTQMYVTSGISILLEAGPSETEILFASMFASRRCERSV